MNNNQRSTLSKLIELYWTLNAPGKYDAESNVMEFRNDLQVTCPISAIVMTSDKIEVVYSNSADQHDKTLYTINVNEKDDIRFVTYSNMFYVNSEKMGFILQDLINVFITLIKTFIQKEFLDKDITPVQ